MFTKLWMVGWNRLESICRSYSAGKVIPKEVSLFRWLGDFLEVFRGNCCGRNSKEPQVQIALWIRRMDREGIEIGEKSARGSKYVGMQRWWREGIYCDLLRVNVVGSEGHD